MMPMIIMMMMMTIASEDAQGNDGDRKDHSDDGDKMITPMMMMRILITFAGFREDDRECA